MSDLVYNLHVQSIRDLAERMAKQHGVTVEKMLKDALKDGDDS